MLYENQDRTSDLVRGLVLKILGVTLIVTLILAITLSVVTQTAVSKHIEEQSIQPVNMAGLK